MLDFLLLIGGRRLGCGLGFQVVRLLGGAFCGADDESVLMGSFDGFFDDAPAGGPLGRF